MTNIPYFLLQNIFFFTAFNITLVIFSLYFKYALCIFKIFIDMINYISCKVILKKY